MRRVRYIIAFALCCVVTDACAEALKPTRLGVQVFHDGKREEGLSDRLTVALAETPGLKVVERSLFDRLLQEWEVQGLAPSAAPGYAMGQIDGVDIFVWVHFTENADDGMLEVVSARTGQWLAKVRCDREYEPLFAMIVNLVQRLQDKPMPSGATAPAIAVAFPESSIDEALPEEVLRRLTADLSGMLVEGRIMVLHRQFTDLLVKERWWDQKGVIASSGQPGLLRGSDAILIPSVTRKGDSILLGLALLDIATGIRIAEAQWPVVITDESLQVPDSVVAWVQQSLEVHLPALQSPKRSPRREKLSPETLRLFSRGLLLFNEGRYCEALDYLMETATHDLRFHDPVHWMSACFGALDFREVVDHLTAFWSGTKNLDAESPRHPNRRLRLELSPGVNLLGVSGGDSTICPEPGAMQRLLSEAIEANRREPVFRSSDWRYLINEYDALIGVEKAFGHGWSRVPLLLFEDTLSAHLTRHGDQWRMDVARIHRLEPETIRRITVELPPDTRKWLDAITDGIRRLFSEPGKFTGTPVPEPFCDSRSLIDLLSASKQNRQFSDYCALLRCHPAIGIRYGKLPAAALDNTYRNACLFDPIEFGIKAWIRRVLPDDDPIKINQFVSKYTLMQNNMPVLPPSETVELFKGRTPDLNYLRAHVARFHDPEVEIVVTYNMLMNHIKRSNYRQTRDALDALLRRPAPASFLSPIRSAHAAISVALGEAYELTEYGYGIPRHEMGIWEGYVKADEGVPIWGYQFSKQLAPSTHYLNMYAEPMCRDRSFRRHGTRENGEDAGLLFLRQHEYERDVLPKEDILEYAANNFDLLPGSPIVLDHVSSRMYFSWINGFARSDKPDVFYSDWQDRPNDKRAEAYVKLCEIYAANLIRFLDSSAPDYPVRADNYWLQILVVEGQKQHEPGIAEQLKFMLVRVGQSAARAVNENRYNDKEGIAIIKAQGWLEETPPVNPVPKTPTEQELKEAMEREWSEHSGPGHHWRMYMKWKYETSGAAEWRRVCIAFEDRFIGSPESGSYQQRKRDQRLTLPMVRGSNEQQILDRNLALLAWFYYRLNEDDRAERLYSLYCGIDANKASAWELVSRQADGEREKTRQNAWFMRVLLAHRAGDVPRAFRVAQDGIASFEGVNYMAQPTLGYGKNFYPVFASYTVLEYLRAFVERARATPDLPFVCPIETGTAVTRPVN